MDDCIFCKILAGQIPSYKIYEDQDVLAFLDIGPVNYGHSLVVPKEHYANLEEIPEAALHKLMSAVKIVGQAVKEKLGAEGYNVTLNNDPIAGQVIPHLHFHIIPRAEHDGLELWPQGKYADGEIEEAQGKLRITN
jgi:histidine triad (HIT) family protein